MHRSAVVGVALLAAGCQTPIERARHGNLEWACEELDEAALTQAEHTELGEIVAERAPFRIRGELVPRDKWVEATGGDPYPEHDEVLARFDIRVSDADLDIEIALYIDRIWWGAVREEGVYHAAGVRAPVEPPQPNVALLLAPIDGLVLLGTIGMWDPELRKADLIEHLPSASPERQAQLDRLSGIVRAVYGAEGDPGRRVVNAMFVRDEGGEPYAVWERRRSDNDAKYGGTYATGVPIPNDALVVTVHHRAHTRCQFTNLVRFPLPPAPSVENRLRAALQRDLASPTSAR